MFNTPPNGASRDRKIQSIHNTITRNRNAYANAVEADNVNRIIELEAEYEELSLKLDALFRS